MAPNFIPLLFIFYLSSALLSPDAAMCVPRMGPYDSLPRDYLPPLDSFRPSLPSDSHAPSPSPSTSPPTPKSAPSPSKAPAPLTPSSSPSDAPSPSVTEVAAKAIKSKMTNTDKLINVLDGSLKTICGKLPFPDLCMAELPSAAEDDIKAIDLNGALGLAIMDLLNEARITRDKARTLVTNDFVYDPINLCNRTMGGALSDSKDALASYGLRDWGSVKSNFDSYVHRLGVCAERKPQGLMAEMEKMDKLWQNANAILCTIDPKLKPAR